MKIKSRLRAEYRDMLLISEDKIMQLAMSVGVQAQTIKAQLKKDAQILSTPAYVREIKPILGIEVPVEITEIYFDDSHLKVD